MSKTCKYSRTYAQTDRQAENIMPQAPFVGWAKAYAITNKPKHDGLRCSHKHSFNFPR